MSDERKRELVEEAREWSRVVEADPDWRKGYVEDGLYHVARLSDALEAALDRERELRGTHPAQLRSAAEAPEAALGSASASGEDSQRPAHWLRDAGFGGTESDDRQSRGGWAG